MHQSDEKIIDVDLGNISDYLKRNDEHFPDKLAILYPRQITYRELEMKVNQYSFGLDHAGIKTGTKVLLLVPAGLDFIIMTFALLRIGAIPVLIDPGMGIRAMLKAIAGTEPEAFVGSSKANLLPIAFPRAFKKIRIRITTGPFSFSRVRRLRNIAGEDYAQYPSYFNYPDDMVAIFFTSGSTGPAKGVIYTSGMLRNQIEITKSLFKIGSEEVDLCTFPLLGLFAICHGNSSVFADMDMLHPAKLNPRKIIKNIVDFGCTQMFGSPVVLNKLAESGSINRIILPSLRNIISAGAPVQPNILESFRSLIPSDAKIHTPYGATEVLPVTDITDSELLQIYSENPENEYGICIGTPVEQLNVKVLEISDNPVESWEKAKLMSANEVGEIVVKGPWVSTGYFENKEADRLSKIVDITTNNIWHRTGDLGKIDLHGRLWFYGRKSHRVITCEGTLFTIPCEAVFNRHPYVARSALVGVRTNMPGIKKPVICIRLKSGFHPTEKLTDELLELGSSYQGTSGILNILFKRKFPVDPRHNAKIVREKLALWAEKRIK
jgi:acyl-coenzyme A synthetase/AMP-(fatty) acid ligase